MRAFETHLLRNNSIIIDKMLGQYKSQVKCPLEDCGKESITFDPFMTLTLPVPGKKVKKIELTFYGRNSEKKKISVEFDKAKNCTMKDLAVDVYRKLEIPEYKFLDFKLVSSYFKDDVKLSDEIADMKKKSSFRTLIMREIPDIEVNIPDENKFQVYLQVSYPYNDYYKKTLGTLNFFYADIDWSLKELGQYVASFFKGLFPNEELNQIYEMLEENNSPFKIQIESNSQGWRECYFCKKKCDKCFLEFSDILTVKSFKESIPESEKENFKFQLNVIWNQKNDKKISIEEVENFVQVVSENENLASNDKTVASLEDCLRLFKEPEKLDADNAWYCNKCKEFREATKKLEIYKAPKFLAVHLKRFRETKKNGNVGLSKIEALVNFPIDELDMTEYVINPDYPCENSQNVENPEKKIIYELFGVVNHMGSINFGHYTAFCKNFLDNDWYCFDDSTVSHINKDNVVSKAAYILFYSRKE